jgi:hypothetical protein
MKIFFQVYPERDFNLRRLLQRQADGRLRLLRRRIHRRCGTGSIHLLLLQFVKIKIYFYRNSKFHYFVCQQPGQSLNEEPLA